MVLALAVTAAEVRRRVAALRQSIEAGSTPFGDATPGVEATTRRLAQQVDVHAPEVRVVEIDRPQSFTVGSGADAVVVVSTGLLDVLDGREPAPGVNHLANWDCWMLAAAFAAVHALASAWGMWTPTRPNSPVTGRPRQRAPETRRRTRLAGDRPPGVGAVAAADILPSAPDVSTGPFRTRPPLEDRLEHLERLTRTAGSGAS